ncbi:MAG TPA: TIGR02679 family protein [Albitalea sp.]|nr:TIGR02679 family protein [Albitalea sp.]
MGEITDKVARLHRLLGGEALAPLRRRLRERYARGMPPDTFTLALAPLERQALEALLGRSARSAESMRLSHAEFDAALQRAALARSLRDALEALDGAIVDRAAARLERDKAWSAVFASVAEARLSRWLAGAAERGLLKRLAGAGPTTAARLLADAATVLRRLPERGIARAQLAATALGDAHALDDGRALATLVLAAADPDPYPADADPEGTRPRNRWARLGVVVGELSAPVLLLNVPAQPDTPGGALAEQGRALGEPLHLSLRLLLRDPPRWQVAGADVFVCENPSIVALAAERLGRACAPLVCTDGLPAAAQRTLLGQLAAQGARLRHHADFDSAGLVIGNLLARRLGAVPWRFGAEDYRRHAPRHGRRLDSVLMPAAWDAELAPAMAEHGHALDEEAMAEALLADLEVAASPGAAG